MENLGNDIAIGKNKTGDESSQMGERDTGNLTKLPYMQWNGLSQSWEHIKGSVN